MIILFCLSCDVAIFILKPSASKIPMLNKIRFKKILQLSLDWCRPKDPPISLGAASIVSHLRSHNVDVSSVSYNVNSPQFDTDAVVHGILQAIQMSVLCWE